jgi:hypothetical protein
MPRWDFVRETPLKKFLDFRAPFCKHVYIESASQFRIKPHLNVRNDLNFYSTLLEALIYI